MPHALEVEHLSVAFGRTRVLDDLTFQVEVGSSLAIIGPNGSGKTVLLEALIGAVPAEGTIRWAPGIDEPAEEGVYELFQNLQREERLTLPGEHASAKHSAVHDPRLERAIGVGQRPRRGGGAESMKRLRTLLSRARKAGVRARCLILNGVLHEALNRAARRHRADLLVLGTHGRTSVARFFVGSVASRVVATAPCPVLTIRGR